MKRIIPLFLVLFLYIHTPTATNHKTSPTSVGASSFNDVIVAKEFMPWVLKFYNIMEKNNIKIDWENISSINVVPLKYGTQGIYSRDTKIILIQPFQIASLSTKAYNNMLLVILAHEIGHSQGFEHTSKYGVLMSRTDGGIYDVIENDKLTEEFILAGFNH